jgi:hypothetical protein
LIVIERRHCSPFVDVLRRSFAAGCAALVLLLVTLAASPDLHARLHAADNTHSEEGCAVTLFASGVSLTCTAILIPLPPVAWVEQTPAEVAEVFVATPRYLRQPERGPPVS